MSNSNPSLETKTHNVNNQRLFKEIDDFMVEMFAAAAINWHDEYHREQMVDLVEDTILDIAAVTGKIVQYDVICDRRNNSRTVKNKVNFAIKYKQKNCLNMTVIEYTLTA